MQNKCFILESPVNLSKWSSWKTNVGKNSLKKDLLSMKLRQLSARLGSTNLKSKTACSKSSSCQLGPGLNRKHWPLVFCSIYSTFNRSTALREEHEQKKILGTLFLSLCLFFIRKGRILKRARNYDGKRFRISSCKMSDKPNNNKLLYFSPRMLLYICTFVCYTNFK